MMYTSLNTDRRFISRVYEECLRTNEKKGWNCNRKWEGVGTGNVQKRKRGRQTGKEEDVVRRIQFKTATCYHFAPVGAAKIRKLDAAMCWPRCEDEWTLILLAGTWARGQIKEALTLSPGNAAPESPSEWNTQVSEGTPSGTFISALSLLAESGGQSGRPPYLWEQRIRIWWRCTRSPKQHLGGKTRLTWHWVKN